MLIFKLLILTALFTLVCSCDIASKAIVVVNTTGQATVSTPNTPSQPTISESPVSSKLPITQASNSNPVAIPLPTINNNVGDLSFFKTKVPRPESVKGYLRTEIKLATGFFQERYNTNKMNAYEVLKMAIDAELLGAANVELRNSLLSVVFAQNGPEANTALSNFNKDIGSPEDRVALYYQNVEIDKRLGKVSYENFDNRVILLVKESTSSGSIELIPISRPEDFLPENPKDGDQVGLVVKYNKAYSFSEFSPKTFKFIFDNGWKYLYSGI